jgi:hypothetical protein
MLIGFCATYAEPAVGVHNKQVEEATSGTIPPKVLPMAMALGVALSAGIAMTRALTGIPILPFLIVGYVVAVVLSYFCPSLFTSIAFDAGGVASGVMAATFMLPLAIGICEARGAADSVMIDAFGTIALIAMAPPISIQIAGVMYKLKLKRTETAEAIREADGEIVELDFSAINDTTNNEIEIIEFSFDFINV